MPNLLKGQRFTEKGRAGGLFAAAQRMEADAVDPKSPDDPRWCLRAAKQLKTIARHKEKARESRWQDRRKKANKILRDADFHLETVLMDMESSAAFV